MNCVESRKGQAQFVVLHYLVPTNGFPISSYGAHADVKVFSAGVSFTPNFYVCQFDKYCSPVNER